MFEEALRRKFRFPSPKGELTVEDLWDLPLTSDAGRANLDDIARLYHSQLRNDAGVSFVHPERKSEEVFQKKFDLVKYIIDVRLAENSAQKTRRENSAKAQNILAIIADKENEMLKSMSVEDLRKMKEALEAL